MHAVRIHRFGGADVLEVDEVPTPQPAADEILVRVRATSINPVDYKIRSGKFPIDKQKLPFTLGRDVSGVVEACGAAVRKFRDGHEIYAMTDLDHGAYAEHVVIKEDAAASKPESLTHVQAAAIPLAALTAWQGLIDHGHVRPGQRVLIHGGAGGVGHFAIQFAKVRGATVFTTVSREDLEFARKLGADEAIDYKAQRFEDIARDMNVVFDLVGGETHDRSWAVLKEGGVLVSTLGEPSQDKALQHGVRAAGYMAQPNGHQLAEIARLIDDGKVRPEVAEVFRLEDARQAQERLEKAHVRGKVVLDVAA